MKKCKVEVEVRVLCCEGWQDTHCLSFRSKAGRHYGQHCAMCGQQFIVTLEHRLEERQWIEYEGQGVEK